MSEPYWKNRELIKDCSMCGEEMHYNNISMLYECIDELCDGSEPMGQHELDAISEIQFSDA